MAKTPVDAVILVGGKGTRLRPLTLSAPKPMLPTAGVPFLTHLLSRIAGAGIEHVILGTSYRAEVFETEFGDGSKLGLQIEYVTESNPLGTGGDGATPLAVADPLGGSGPAAMSNTDIPGDANHDNKVDGADISIWSSNYDPLGLNDNTWQMGDRVKSWWTV